MFVSVLPTNQPLYKQFYYSNLLLYSLVSVVCYRYISKMCNIPLINCDQSNQGHFIGSHLNCLWIVLVVNIIIFLLKLIKIFWESKSNITWQGELSVNILNSVMLFAEYYAFIFKYVSCWQLSTGVWSFINITSKKKKKKYNIYYSNKKKSWKLQRSERSGRRIAWNNFPGYVDQYFSENTRLTSGHFFFLRNCCRGRYRYSIFYFEKVLTCLLNDLPFSWDLYMSNDVFHFLNVYSNRSTYCDRHDRKAMDIIWRMAGNWDENMIK